MDTKPPISRAKMISITKSAIKAMKVRMNLPLCSNEQSCVVVFFSVSKVIIFLSLDEY